MRRFGQLASAGLWLVAGSLSAQGPPVGGDPSPPNEVTPLAVPYLAQTQLLCGGAALAMVERWWGRRGVFAEDFAALVRPELGGIRTTDLAAAAVSRGWDARETEQTVEAVQGNLRAGVPVIALIEVARGRFHFVVLLAWDGGQVSYHDPAQGPNRTASEAWFVARWTAARRWALAVRPDPATARLTPVHPDTAAAPAVTPCAPWLDRAIDAAVANRLEDAVLLLEEAGRACPAEPVIARELAAVRFRQRRYTESIRLAREYLALVPDDTLGWQLLASGRYLVGDRNGALDAWNRIGRPVIDLVRIDGSRNIRFKVLADHIGAPLGAVLAPGFLDLARRRLSDVPGVRHSLVDYDPVAGGLAEVRIVVDERPVVDPIWMSLASGATRAIAQDEMAFAVASPTRLGELWSAKWRWESARPRVALRVDLPATLGVPGAIHMSESWERFRFVPGPSGQVMEERRHAIESGFGGWLTAQVRPAISVGYDRWSEDRRFVTVSAGLSVRARNERLRLEATGTQASGLSGTRPWTALDASARWASALGIARSSWSARGGWNRVSEGAPLGTWPVAGTNFDWAIPLRAHPAARGGLIDPRSTGRRIAHAGVTADRPVRRFGLLMLGTGVFVDGARIMNPGEATPANGWLFDAGAGLRVGVGDGGEGVFRIDWARGLTDGRMALSVGLQREWPPFE